MTYTVPFYFSLNMEAFHDESYAIWLESPLLPHHF